jgi:hypothetical protein
MRPRSTARIEASAARPLTPSARGAALDGPRARRGIPCAACGGELRLLEERHLVDGRAFHTVCVRTPAP